MFSGGERKRDILNPTVAATVFRAVWQDERAKLANMLAAFLHFLHDWKT